MSAPGPASLRAAVIGALLTAAALPLHSAFKDGPPARVTGGFGEDSCVACHFGSAVNEPGGTLEIVGVPPAYTPGERYRLQLRLTREGMRVGGFQLAARHSAANEESGVGTQAGAFELPAENAGRAAILRERGIEFVHHTYDGVQLRDDGTALWIVDWIAPDEDRGWVHLHAAAVAANDDDSEIGDFVHTAEVLTQRTRKPLPPR